MDDVKYSFVHRDLESSVYAYVAHFLKNRGGVGTWKIVGRESCRFHLMLGDRNKLPWHKIGQVPGLTQLINYYRGSEIICRKSLMVRTMKDYCEEKKLRLFEWLPASFIINPPCDVVETVADEKIVLARRSRTDEREHLKKYSTKYPEVKWIAKASCGSKGEGIKISRDIETLLDMIDDQNQSYIIQHYIDKPLLLKGRRKFDIRCWVLLDGNYNIYMFREGVLRTSSEEYRPEDLDHVTSHLTNHSLQKDLSENFGKYEVGNEMFYEEFDSYLSEEFGVSLESTLLCQIRSIVKTCLNIIQNSLSTSGLDYRSFQLFGFDFLVDEDMKVWLLEVNGAPACAEKLLPVLVPSLVQTAIDPIYPPFASAQHDDDNLFDLI